MEQSLEIDVAAAWARAARVVEFSVESALAQVGMTPTEHEILRALFDSCSLNISDLGKIAVLTKSGASRAIKHMEQAGWVERKASGTDRRAMAVSITPAGHEKFLEATEAIQPVVDKYLLDNLSPRDTRELMRFLANVVAAGEEECTEANA
jgi:DNA-binding MarR family transcriptional regulator